MAAAENGGGESSGRNTNLLQTFWSLAETDPEVRLAAAKELVEIDSVRQKDSSDHQYTVKRLVRGLSSSRGFARQGFAVALTQLIRVCPFMDLKALLDQIVESTAVTGAMKGIETRNNYFGRIFGFIALLRSGKCREDFEILNTIVELSVQIAWKKRWAQEIAVDTVCKAMELAGKDGLQRIMAHNGDFGIKTKSINEMSASMVYLVAAIDILTFENKKARKTAKMSNVPLLLPSYKNKESDDVDMTVFESLAGPLQDATHSSPRLHCMWAKLLPAILNQGITAFSTFWSTLMKQFLVNVGHERKYTALKLLPEAVQLLVSTGNGEKVLDTLMVPDLIHTLQINQRSKETVLNKVTLATLQEVNIALRDQSVPPSVRVSLLNKLGNKTANEKAAVKASLKPSASEEPLPVSDVIKEVELLKSQALDSQNDLWLDSMYALSKRVTAQEERYGICLDLAKFFLKEGFLDSASTSSEDNTDSNKTAALFREKAQILFINATQDMQIIERNQLSRLVVREEPVDHLFELRDTDSKQLRCGLGIFTLNRTIDEEKLDKPLSEAEQEARQSALAASDSLLKALNISSSKKSKSKKANQELSLSQKKLANGLSLILECMALQTVTLSTSGRVNLDIVETLDDLVQAAEELGNKHGLLSSSNKDEDEEEEEDSMAIFTDALIATLTQPSVMIRTAVSFTYRLISDFVTVSSLDTVMEVLLSKDAVEVSKEEEEEEDEEDESEEEEEKTTKKTTANGKSETKTQRKKKQSLEDDEAEEYELGHPKNQIPMDDEKIGGFVGALASAAELFDSDIESEGDEDDESRKEMKAYDKAIGDFLKLQIDQKELNSSKTKQHIGVEKINLKLRVLDMVQEFVASQPKNDLVSLIPLCLHRAALLCFLQGGTNKKGSVGDVSNQLFGRLKQTLEDLVKSTSHSGFAKGNFSIENLSGISSCVSFTEHELKALKSLRKVEIEDTLPESKSITPVKLAERMADVFCTNITASVNHSISNFSQIAFSWLLKKSLREPTLSGLIVQRISLIANDFVNFRKSTIKTKFLLQLVAKNELLAYELSKAVALAASKSKRLWPKVEACEILRVSPKHFSKLEQFVGLQPSLLAVVGSMFSLFANEGSEKGSQTKRVRSALKFLRENAKTLKQKGGNIAYSDYPELKEGLLSVLPLSPDVVAMNAKADVVKFLTENFKGVEIPDYKSSEFNPKKRKVEQTKKESKNKRAKAALAFDDLNEEEEGNSSEEADSTMKDKKRKMKDDEEDSAEKKKSKKQKSPASKKKTPASSKQKVKKDKGK